MTRLRFLALISFSIVTASAAPVPEKEGHGTCYVCKYNDDLACVNFRLKKDTPSVVYRGQTYFFCGSDCQSAFLKKPEKYAPKK